MAETVGDYLLARPPVPAIVGQTARRAMGGHYQQEIDLPALYKDMASECPVEVNVAGQLPNAVDRAFKRVPSSPPGPIESTVRPSDDLIRREGDPERLAHDRRRCADQGPGVPARVTAVKPI